MKFFRKRYFLLLLFHNIRDILRGQREGWRPKSLSLFPGSAPVRGYNNNNSKYSYTDNGRMKILGV